jgi:hypothetical protein
MRWTLENAQFCTSGAITPVEFCKGISELQHKRGFASDRRHVLPALEFASRMRSILIILLAFHAVVVAQGSDADAH